METATPTIITRLQLVLSDIRKKVLQQRLKRINKKIPYVQPQDIPQLFENIPLDVFGKLMLDTMPEYPNIKAFLPSMPPDEIQDNWTGAHGITLLMRSVAFINTLITEYTSLTRTKIKDAIILDYGCGWGRLIRLLYKFVSYENVYGVDPWDKSIEQCKRYGIKANLAICDYVPKELPFDKCFNLIFAFSVFTHLSEKTTHVVLSTLRKYIANNGLLVITIRPREFWLSLKHEKSAEMLQLHEKNGFAFIPHNRQPIDGDITYGLTTMSLEYIERNFPEWELIKTITNNLDRHQTILFLHPK